MVVSDFSQNINVTDSTVLRLSVSVLIVTCIDCMGRHCSSAAKLGQVLCNSN